MHDGIYPPNLFIDSRVGTMLPYAIYGSFWPYVVYSKSKFIVAKPKLTMWVYDVQLLTNRIVNVFTNHLCTCNTAVLQLKQKLNNYKIHCMHC